MPNRRRRRLSTATSAVAALAVVSPFAISAISDMTKPAPQPREFRSAAMVTDLPNELMSALSQGLSQFGINLPAMPSGLTGAVQLRYSHADDVDRPRRARVAGTDVSCPDARPRQSRAHPRPDHAGPWHRPGGSPCRSGTCQPRADQPDAPDAGRPGGDAGAGGRRRGGEPGPEPRADQPDRGTSRRSDDASGHRARPGAGDDADLNAAGLPAPGEVPISAPIGLDPAAGTYPILGGDPGLGLGSMPAASTGGGGIFGELSSAAQQLGAGQAIDLLKGVVMPMITSAMKPAARSHPRCLHRHHLRPPPDSPAP